MCTSKTCVVLNFSERQHCLGNCFLGSRNAGNGVSEYCILKISWESMPPDPPRCLRLRRSRGTLRRQENIHVRCFQKYVRYFTKQLKTLHVNKHFWCNTNVDPGTIFFAAVTLQDNIRQLFYIYRLCIVDNSLSSQPKD